MPLGLRLLLFAVNCLFVLAPLNGTLAAKLVAQSPDTSPIALALNTSNRIAFYRYEGDDYGNYVEEGTGIFSMNPDGSGRTKLAPPIGYAPVWSPDGTRIAFLANDRKHLYTMNSDGSSLSMILYTGEMKWTQISKSGQVG